MKKLVTVVLSLVIISCQESAVDAPPASVSDIAARPVELVEISPGVLLEEIELTGPVRGYREARVVAETQGQITELAVRLGQKLAAGDLLLQVDNTLQALELEQAKQDLETVEIELGAKEELYRSGGVSRADYAASRARLTAARTRYQRALKSYNDCSVRSPIGGYISQLPENLTAGNYLLSGSLVAGISDIERLELRGAVGEDVVGLLSVGASAEIRVPAACPDQSFRGSLTAISAGSDPATGSYTVLVQWENSCGTKVKSGMSAYASIRVQGGQESLLLPSSAVLRRGGGDMVFLEKQGKAVLRRVTLGRGLGNRRVVLDGVRSGERVLISGTDGLKEGDPLVSEMVGKSGDLK